MVGNHVLIDDSHKVVCWLIFPLIFPLFGLALFKAMLIFLR